MKFDVGRDWNTDWVNKELYLGYFIAIESNWWTQIMRKIQYEIS
jgi:hypothetical protein